MARTRSAMIAALDVGTTKVSCFIANLHGDGGIRIAGIGHHAAAGMRCGVIIDMDAAEGAILKPSAPPSSVPASGFARW